MFFKYLGEEASKLKKQYGLSDRQYIEHDYVIKLNTYAGDDQKGGAVKCSDLVAIMESRINEIFTIIYQSLKDNNLLNEIKHCVITGSGFNSINKVEKSLENILKIEDIRFGNAKTANLIKPECITSYGIVKYISNIKYTKNIGSTIKKDEDDSTFKSLRKAFTSVFNKNKK